jgi:arylsulfatase A-like enzyme
MNTKSTSEIDSITKNNRHILLITIDCGRADCVTGAEAQTPHIEGLCHDGITFNQAFCQANVTIPSLYSLLTSNYLSTHGIYGNTRYYPLPSHSLPKILNRHKWKTASFTGIHFVHHLLGQEFDNYPRLGKRLYPYAMKLSLRFPQMKRYLGLNRWDAGKCVQKAIKWLNRNSQKHNCFLWLHFFDAHMPYYAPQNLIQQDLGDLEKFRSHSSISEQLSEKDLFSPFSKGPLAEAFYDISYLPSLYKISLKYIDHELGRLFQNLKDRDLYKNTLIALTSDHGENLVEHGVYCHHRKLYDTTTHVPLIIKDLNNTFGGSQIDSIVQHIDIAPTLLNRLKITPPENFSGKNLWPLIEGASFPVNEYAFCEHAHNYQRSLRTEKWQYIQTEKNPVNFRAVASQNYSPNEFPLIESDTLLDRTDLTGRNLINEHPDIEKKLGKHMRELINQCYKKQTAQEELPEALKKQLEGLGYF